MATQAPVAPADYLKQSFDGLDREFCYGEVVERSMPTYMHARLQALLAHLFFHLAENHKLFPATELRLAIQPDRIYRIPDVCLFANHEPAGGVGEFPPVVVVEINSPDDKLSATLKKFSEYQAWGIEHIWLIDGEERSLFRYDTGGLHPVEALELPEYGFRIGLAELGL